MIELPPGLFRMELCATRWLLGRVEPRPCQGRLLSGPDERGARDDSALRRTVAVVGPRGPPPEASLSSRRKLAAYVRVVGHAWGESSEAQAAPCRPVPP